MPLAIYTSAAWTANGGIEPAAGATVEVRSESTGGLASLFEDRDGSSGLDNPFTADAQGRFAFFVAGGAYRVKATDEEGNSHTMEYQAVGTAQSRDVGTGADEVPDNAAINSRGFAQSVDSVANLRAASFPDSLERIWLSGYYGVGTAGGGSLYRDADDTTTADNGGTVFVDSDGVRWVRHIGNSIALEDFGIHPGDYSSDNGPVEDAFNVMASMNKTITVGEGVWVWPGTLTVSLPESALFRVRGSGKDKTIFRRSARNLDVGNPRLFSVVSSGDQAVVDISEVQFDGNARENPLLLQVDDSSGFTIGETIVGGTSLTEAVVLVLEEEQIGVDFDSGTFESGEVVTGQLSGATATTTAELGFAAKEQTDCLGTIGDYDRVKIESVKFYDPTGDGWNQRAGFKRTVKVKNLIEEARTRFRNLITYNGGGSMFDAGQIEGRVSFESASNAEGILTAKVKNCQNVRLNLAYNGNENALTEIENCRIFGLAGGGWGRTILTNCRVEIGAWRPTGATGRMTFNGCEFWGAEGGEGLSWSDLGTSLIGALTAAPRSMIFYDCTFRPLPDSMITEAGLDQILGFGGSWDNYEIRRCRFLETRIPAIAIRPNANSALLAIDDNEFHYNPNGGEPQNIRHTRELFPQTLAEQNVYQITNNRIMHPDGKLIRFVSFYTNFNDIPILYTFGGNQYIGSDPSGGPMYVVPSTLDLVSPHGTGAHIKIQRLDNLEGDAAPTTGDYVQGQKLYRRVPVAEGNEGWVCVESGAPGTWKEFGSVEL